MRVHVLAGKASNMDLPQDIKSSLLHAVDEVNQGAGGSWLVDQQENLRSPELDVGLAGVKEEKILAHLVEDQGLADGAPVGRLGRGEDVQSEGEGEAEQEGDRGEEGRGEEHRGRRANQAHQAGRPGEVLKGWPEIGCRGEI